MDHFSKEAIWSWIKDPERSCMVEHLGIEILEITQDGVKAKMPVDQRTKQYFGLLHGGASVVLAETVASIASVAHIDTKKERAVGLEINANHLRAVSSGWVNAEAKAVHLGRKTHVWQIEIRNEEGKLTCLSRCTMAIVEAKP
jgi:1,4-dihydroxy-2-naphthoyl-CoA hydrolase